MIKKILRFVLFLSIGLFIIWWFQRGLSVDEMTQIKNAFVGIRYEILAFSLLVALLSHVLRALRWNMLLGTMDYKPSVTLSFLAVMIGYFANLAIPRMGEVVRCGILQRYAKIPLAPSFGTVVTERLIDVLVFGLAFALSLILEITYLKTYVWSKLSETSFVSGNFWIWAITLLLTGLIGLIVLFFLYRKYKEHFEGNKLFVKLRDLIKDFWQGLICLKHLKNYPLFIVYSLGIWICYWIALYLAFLAMPAIGSVNGSIVLACLVMGTFGYMITPGGIGLYPVIVSETFSVFGLDKLLGYAGAWLAWASQTIIFILTGLISLLTLPIFYNKRKN